MATVHGHRRGDRIPRSDRLARLLVDAADARRGRALLARHGCAEGDSVVERRGARERASDLLEDLLTGPMPARVDVGDYLSDAVSLHVAASERVDEIRSSIQRLSVSTMRARAMAAIITELVHFVDTCVPRYDCAALRIGVERDDDRLLMTIAAQGDHRLVGSESGLAALLRARALVEAMRGCFGRGAFIDGMVFGVVLPTPRRRRVAPPTAPLVR